jgi:hypothetical protein
VAEAGADVGVVDWGGESSFAAVELRRTSGVFDGSVVCEMLLNCAVKGSKKVGGRRRESRQHARLAARERNMLCGLAISPVDCVHCLSRRSELSSGHRL